MRQQKYLERERERICSGPVFLTYTGLQSERLSAVMKFLYQKKNSLHNKPIRNAWQVIKIMRSTESVIYSDLGFTA